MTIVLTAAMRRQALAEILDRHKLWVHTNGAEGERLSLRGANLTGIDLDGADLWRASMKKTNLVEADFQEANLDKATFWKASLVDVDFADANTGGATPSRKRVPQTPLLIPTR
jgi:uncharacterized protein YjbI with pentapeptide repeats